MRAVVTGGAGFIGSHLTERLLAQGHDVVVIDDLSTGRIENLSAVRDNRRLRIQQASILDFDALLALLIDAQWVFHLAGRADIVPSIEKPIDYFSVNVQGTINTLEAARGAGVKRFIYAASSSSYGIPDVYPTPETAPIRPRYPYALTKHMGEELVLHWAQMYRFPALSLRLFNVYGPRTRTTGAYGAVFGVFLAQLANRKPLTVVGDGSQTRDFTFVTDVADAFIAAANANEIGCALNVGSGHTYSINRVVELLAHEFINIPKRPGEPDCTYADISNIKQLLQWQPRVSFEEGVKRMTAHLEEWRHAPVWEPNSIARATRTWFQHLREDRSVSDVVTR